MVRIEKTILSFAVKTNWIAAGAVVGMMLLTTLDVVLRFFRHPIPGTYEIVGLLGTVVISFSLAYTSIEKGHIAVEFLIRRFSPQAQALANAFNALVAALLFAVIAWQSILYAMDLMHKGEVSLTVQMPIYPFVFGIAAGCSLLCPVLFIDCIKAIRMYRLRKSK